MNVSSSGGIPSRNEIIAFNIPLTSFEIKLTNLAESLPEDVLDLFILTADEMLMRCILPESSSRLMHLYTKTVSQELYRHRKGLLSAQTTKIDLLIKFTKEAQVYTASLPPPQPLVSYEDYLDSLPIPSTHSMDLSVMSFFINPAQTSALRENLTSLEPELFSDLGKIEFSRFVQTNSTEPYQFWLIRGLFWGVIVFLMYGFLFLRQRSVYKIQKNAVKKELQNSMDDDNSSCASFQSYDSIFGKKKAEKSHPPIMPSKTERTKNVSNEDDEYDMQYLKRSMRARKHSRGKKSYNDRLVQSTLVMLERYLSDPYVLYLDGTKPGKEDWNFLRFVSELPPNTLSSYPNVANWSFNLKYYYESAKAAKHESSSDDDASETGSDISMSDSVIERVGKFAKIFSGCTGELEVLHNISAHGEEKKAKMYAERQMRRKQDARKERWKVLYQKAMESDDDDSDVSPPGTPRSSNSLPTTPQSMTGRLDLAESISNEHNVCMIPISARSPRKMPQFT